MADFHLKPSATLHLQLPAAAAGRFTALMGTGVGILTWTGTPLMTLLCDQLGIGRDYVDQRVQTIFVNGRAVDQLDEVILGPNAVVALSAAMPGLVGATFRRQGLLAGFRKGITHDPKSGSPGKKAETIILLKLFNLVAREISAPVLRQGVWVKGHHLTALISELIREKALASGDIRWNGDRLTPGELVHKQWQDDWVGLNVVFFD